MFALPNAEPEAEVKMSILMPIHPCGPLTLITDHTQKNGFFLFVIVVEMVGWIFLCYVELL
jgi:hypothetical protein